jgi:hypothetical protein
MRVAHIVLGVTVATALSVTAWATAAQAQDSIYVP